MLRALAALAVVTLVPPVVVATGGGADLDLPGGGRVAFFEAAAPALAALGALFAWLVPPRGGRVWHVLRGLAILQFAVVAGVCWLGGFQTSWLSVRDPLRPALIGLALLALSSLRGLRWPASLRGGRGVLEALALAAGATTLLGAVVASDLSALRGRVAPALAREPAGALPDVIFLLVDTLRADALGAYGASPSVSPTLDALAAESVVFRRAIAQAPWTLPSVFSLMTSRLPSTLDPVHRAAPGDENLARTLPEDVPALVPALRGAGYHTAGFQKNPWLGPGSGLERGFDVYELVGGDSAEYRSAGQLVDAALAWARSVAAVRRDPSARAPVFLYVHFMDPHAGYLPPDAFVPPEARAYDGPVDGSARSLHRVTRRPEGPSERDVAQMRALYRGEVAYLDAEIARLRSGLEALGVWGPGTVVVLCADHGEQFGEHGRFEHRDVHTENVHVPLLVRVPGVPPGRVDPPVPLLDLAPTLLDLLGVDSLPGREGRSLLDALHGAPVEPRPVLTEFGPESRVTTSRWSLLRREEGIALYDLEADPGETRDRAAERPGAVRALTRVVERRDARADTLQAGASEPPARQVDAETRRALEALGYLRE